MRRRPEYQIDRTSVTEIKLYKKHTEELLQFHWQYYSELAYQRSRVHDKLQIALINNSQGPFKFEDYQRAVKYKYCLDPLSTKGSLSDPGGRFNIGAINPTIFTPFPALYLASDKETSLQELLGQANMNNAAQLSPLELALTKPDSITIVGVRGELDQILDLTHQQNLKDFQGLIKNFKLSTSLLRTAKKLNYPCEVITSLPKLLHSLLLPDWRTFPMLYDIPANPQIFGQIVMSAGIQGILYPSKLSNQACLAIYPQIFPNSSSFVELTGELPENVHCKRLDGTTEFKH